MRPQTEFYWGWTYSVKGFILVLYQFRNDKIKCINCYRNEAYWFLTRHSLYINFEPTVNLTTRTNIEKDNPPPTILYFLRKLYCLTSFIISYIATNDVVDTVNVSASRVLTFK